MGKNKCVAEFTDSNDVGASSYKSWASRHTHNIQAAAANSPQTLVTGSYIGELIFWRLETGQAYGMYDVQNPYQRRTLQYTKEEISRKDDRDQTKSLSRQSNMSHLSSRKSKSKSVVVTKGRKSKLTNHPKSSLGDSCKLPTFAIQSILFLTTRPMQSSTATVFVAITTGQIQLWSHAAGGVFLTSFNAVHTSTDYVVSMTTDRNNDYLITGHQSGYIKIWLLKNYGLPINTEIKICMPELRLKFPFMWGSTFTCRAERARKKCSPLPLLLSSLRGHHLPISSLTYLDDSEIIISGSYDGTARLWTLGGRYLYTLGTFKPIQPLIPDQPVDPEREYSKPADVKRFCSSTTLRVLSGGTLPKPLTKKQKERRTNKEPKIIEGVYGNRIPMDNILGKTFKLPVRIRQPNNIKLDLTLRQIPVYKEFNLPEPKSTYHDPTVQDIKNDAKYFKQRQSRCSKN